MSRKPGKMYRYITQPAYTRREYMGGVPGNRIVQYEMGNPNGKFPITIALVAKERCQIRHTALEACRIAANRVMTKNLGMLGFHMKIRLYPHHVLRENKMATGAGADRISQGMRAAFGKAVGTAARVKVGQTIMFIKVPKNHGRTAKEALRRASMKLPTPTRMIVEAGLEYIR